MRFLFIILLTIFSLIIPLPVFAQNQPGVSVTPSILHIDLSQDPGEFELIYKNNSQSEISLELSASDFSELEDGWKVRFLNDEESKNYHYSLASWIEFERKSISLKPGEEGHVKVFVNKEELSPGGHYGSIQATISSLEQSGKQVDIKGLLSTILFVRTNTGREIEQATISDLSFERPSFFHFPNLFILRFNNQGNTELVPYGSLEIKDVLGRTVGKGILNEGSNYSLPESIKKFEIRTNRLEQAFIFARSQTPFIPGIYRVYLQVDYGNNGLVKYDSSFIYLNPVSVALGLILLVLLGIGLRLILNYLKKNKPENPSKEDSITSHPTHTNRAHKSVRTQGTSRTQRVKN